MYMWLSICCIANNTSGQFPQAFLSCEKLAHVSFSQTLTHEITGDDELYMTNNKNDNCYTYLLTQLYRLKIQYDKGKMYYNSIIALQILRKNNSTFIYVHEKSDYYNTKMFVVGTFINRIL